jgi:hypothetical protein
MLALLGAMMQEPPEYPSGWACSPKGIIKSGRQTAEHPCHCRRMADPATSCEVVTEQATCNQWCHKNKCSCPVICETPK